MKKIGLIFLSLVLAIGFLIPEGGHRIPVVGASAADWNPRSFWYHPWGRSGMHKGIDIFAGEGVPVLAATNGVVVYTGFNDIGGYTPNGQHFGFPFYENIVKRPETTALNAHDHPRIDRTTTGRTL